MAQYAIKIGWSGKEPTYISSLEWDDAVEDKYPLAKRDIETFVNTHLPDGTPLPSILDINKLEGEPQ